MNPGPPSSPAAAPPSGPVVRPVAVAGTASSGEAILPLKRPDPSTFVLFGANGDLSGRKLVPALYKLETRRSLPDRFSLLGVSRGIPAPKEYCAWLRRSLEKHLPGETIDEQAWARFTRRIDTCPGEFDDEATYAALHRKLEEHEKRFETAGNRLFYLATPSGVVPLVLEKLHAAGLLREDAGWARVVIEKPFGTDLDSARKLNELAAGFLGEDQIYRIDHYLGKETVQNILVFRFGNPILEPLWNRKYIDHVQITVAEDIGVGTRGSFYDSTGALRDMVQNHMLQVLALVGMEAPLTFQADDIRDEKTQVFRALRPITGSQVLSETVRAQYEGYRREKDVAPDSRTPTYTALRVHLDNWRWQGVPFYLRTGKKLARRLTEVAIHFQAIPLCLFGDQEVCQRVEPNVLTLRIQPEEGISLRFSTKVPGEDLRVSNVLMDFRYEDVFQCAIGDAYERLLLDALCGDPTLFTRRDGVEAAWRFITPILETWEQDDSSPLPTYPPGSRGPAEADRLLGRDGRLWRDLS